MCSGASLTRTGRRIPSAWNKAGSPELPDEAGFIAAASGGIRSLPVVARALPFALYIALLALGPLLAQWIPALDPRWWYGIRVALVGALLAGFFPHYSELRPADLRSIAAPWWGAALMAGIAVFGVWIHLKHPWAEPCIRRWLRSAQR